MLYTEAYIKDKLSTDDKWLSRGLLAIYKLQTKNEQVAGRTKIKNNIGFSSAHGAFLSRKAKWLLAGWALSGQDLIRTRKFMMHYAKQLTIIANNSPKNI